MEKSLSTKGWPPAACASAPQASAGRSRTALSRGAAAMCVGLLTLVLAGCGSSHSTGTVNGGHNGSASTAASAGSTARSPQIYRGAASIDSAYQGADRQFLQRLDQPRITGHPFKVGYLQINGSIPVLKAQQEAAAAEVKALGGSMIVKDGQNSPTEQVAELNQLLTQGVDAIIAYPVVPGALTTGFKQAAAKHIPVIVIGQQTSALPPNLPATETDVDQAVDYSTYETMKALASRVPKGASFAVVGIGAPIPTLQYLTARETYWGEKFGLKLAGTVPAIPTTPGLTAAAKLLVSKYSDAQAYIALNDYSAVALANAQRVANNTKAVIATANGGDPISIPLIKAGREAVEYRVPDEEIGEQSAIAAYDSVTKQHLPLPKLIQIPGVVVTKTNVNAISPVK